MTPTKPLAQSARRAKRCPPKRRTLEARGSRTIPPIPCTARQVTLGPKNSPSAIAPPYPSPASGPSGTASDASGSAADVSTTSRSVNASAYASRAGTFATSGETVPSTAVAAPASISGGKSGTATRFARGETSDTRPKTAAMIGMVGSVAASVVASPWRIAPGSDPRRREIGSPRYSRPAVAVADSRNPTSPIADASIPTIVATASASALSVAGRRPKARPSDATTAMTAARATLGASPTRTLYARTHETVSEAVIAGRVRPRATSATAVATRVMLKPDIASRCDVPLRAKAVARSASTAARSPSTIPRTIPPSGSGTRRRSGSASASRRPSSGPACRRSKPGRGPNNVAIAEIDATSAAPHQQSRRGRSPLASARIAKTPASDTARATPPSGAICTASAMQTAAAAAGRSGALRTGVTAS